MAIAYSLIGQRIKEFRKKAGLSQDVLAEKLGITQPFLNRWEKGKRHVTLERLGQLSEILDVPIEYLVAGTVVDSQTKANLELSNLMKDCDEDTNSLIITLCKGVVSWRKNHTK